MKLLLDTCVFLWLISGDNRLSKPIRDHICNPTNDVFLSSVSIWECIVKYQIGRLPLPGSPAEYLLTQRKRHQILSLALDEESITHLASLPSIHRDPFDRMLICQAIEHKMIIVTSDQIIPQYPIKILEI